MYSICSVEEKLVTVETPTEYPDYLFEVQTRPPRVRRRLPRPSNAVLVLAAILIAQLMVVLDVTIVNIALPDIKTALDFSPANLSWVINAYSLAFGGLLLLGARAGDILGRRRTLMIGIGLFSAASLAGGFANSEGLLLAMRALQGVGGALASPSALALLMTMFPEGRERIRAIGLYTTVSIGGVALGLIAGGVLTQWASWRWVLFVNVPIGALLLVLARAVLPETERRKGHFDLAGALTSTVGMTALVYGFVRAASDGWGDTTTIASFVIGVLLLGAFVRVELGASSPITPLRLFADRNRVSSYLARLLLTGAMMGMFFFLTQFLQEVLGYGALATGFAFLPLTVMVFGASQLSARVLTQRFGPRQVITFGLTLSTVGIFWMSQLTEHSSYFSVLGPLLLFGIGNGLSFVPLTMISLAGVEPRDAGAASGLVNVMQQVGGALGLAVLVTVFGSVSKHALAHPAAGASASEVARHAFLVGSDRGFLVAGLLLAATVILVATTIRNPSAANHEPVLVD
jgi:EmrB/QacA subfamily drug resistance transporter